MAFNTCHVLLQQQVYFLVVLQNEKQAAHQCDGRENRLLCGADAMSAQSAGRVESATLCSPDVLPAYLRRGWSGRPQQVCLA
jgi:hypothetical protein